MITKQLAEEIVEQTMIRLNRNLNVMDTNGMILASGDKERIDSIHEGAAEVVKSGNILWLSETEAANLRGVKPGVNLPVHFQGQLVGVIGITGEPDELKEISKLVQLTTEMMVHQSLITSRIEWNRKRDELIFEELTSGQPLSAAVRERILQIGLDKKTSYVTVLIELEKPPLLSQRIIEQLETRFHGQVIAVGHSQLNEIFLLLTNDGPVKLETKLQGVIQLFKKTNFVRIGMGTAVDTIFDVRDSYLAAKNALAFGMPDQQLIRYEDVELLALLKCNPQTELDRFTDRVIGKLNTPLCETLTAYFACNRNNAEAADALAIHRHTLSYRLKKIKEVTGLDPADFQDAVSLYLALAIQK